MSTASASRFSAARSVAVVAVGAGLDFPLGVAEPETALLAVAFEPASALSVGVGLLFSFGVPPIEMTVLGFPLDPPIERTAAPGGLSSFFAAVAADVGVGDCVEPPILRIFGGPVVVLVCGAGVELGVTLGVAEAAKGALCWFPV